MARTKTPTNVEKLLSILEQVEGENGLKNRGLLYQTVAARYNDDDSVKDGTYKPISHTIAKWRLDEAGASLKTPLGKRTKEILANVESETPRITVVEETPSGDPVAPKTKKARTKKNNSGINVVKVPTQPPLPLTSLDHENILGWVDRQRAVYERNGEYYTKYAAQHDIRKHIVPDDVEKQRAACDVIRENVQDEYQ